MMFDIIADLKNKGYYPDTILDIGAHHGNWTDVVKNIYNDSKYYLFEAIDYNELKRFENDNNITVYNTILNDKITDVDWWEMRNTGDSIFREKTHHFENCQPMKRTSIDLNSLISQYGILQDAKNIFIKIDCQGAEIPILKGATSILEKTDFIILEMPFFGQYNEGVPNFLEHIAFMDRIGFVPYDIVGNHRLYNFSFQVDFLFINKNHSFNNLIAELFMRK